MNRFGLIPAAAVLALGATACAAAGSTSGVAGPVTSSPPQANSIRSCGPGPARTLAADADARVYDSHGAALACARGSSHRYRLGMDSGTCLRATRVTEIRLAGRMVAYASMSCGVDSGSTVVLVRRLSDGRALVDRRASTRQGVEGHAEVESLVVRPDGAVAWIATEQAFGAPKFLRELARVDRQGRFAILASGAGLEPGSLRLAGATLTWRQAGGARQATLR